MGLGPLNNEVGLEVMKFPKISFSKRVIMVMYKDSLGMVNTPWIYAMHQLLILGTEFKKLEQELSHFLKLYRAQKKSLIFFFFCTAVNRMIPNLEARQILIESLAFENVNLQCKRATRSEEWI